MTGGYGPRGIVLPEFGDPSSQPDLPAAPYAARVVLLSPRWVLARKLLSF